MFKKLTKSEKLKGRRGSVRNHSSSNDTDQKVDGEKKTSRAQQHHRLERQWNSTGRTTTISSRGERQPAFLAWIRSKVVEDVNMMRAAASISAADCDT